MNCMGTADAKENGDFFTIGNYFMNKQLLLL
jgi:hypothetical protein